MRVLCVTQLSSSLTSRNILKVAAADFVQCHKKFDVSCLLMCPLNMIAAN